VNPEKEGDIKTDYAIEEDPLNVDHRQ